ncbi:MAG TPA: FlgD immunoglobulin-like domain containing protein, partial [archaeon]|nr:FlgD immunoglobulin-like domain containing protein [archaeon]
NMVEGLTREDVEYLKSVMAQLDLRAGEKEAFQTILSSHGKTDKAGLPEKFSLSRNVPNPFNPSTSIIYTVPEGPVVQVTLRIYSIRGQLVRTLVDKTCEAGSYNVFWDGTDGAGHHVSSGVYFYRMQAGDFIQTRKMVLLK